MVNQDAPFHIVCIGASAGGLEALERFFKHSEKNTRVAYVVVQHLSTDYKSMMDDLINRYTDIPVCMIENGMQLTPGNIYLIPAGTTIELSHHTFVVSQKRPGVLTLPIDIFLHSLAKEVGKNSIAVILSGTGSDGTRGAMAVNEAGGLVIAQNPEEAKFDGMPKNLINTGIVDVVVPAEDIPRRIQKFVQSAQTASGLSQDNKVDVLQETLASFDEVLAHLRTEYDIDFREYKPATVSRRIERRMQVQHISNFTDYLKLLKKDAAETQALRRELLIPVTNFFRDDEVFEELRSKIIPQLVSNADEKEGIRAWIAGCSTGEEAYSMAMLIMWECAQMKRWLPVKIFATDVNPESIETAALGVYPETIAAEVPQEFLARFFHKEGHEFTVSAELRQSIVFATHNLLQDPPFTKMDLVSCRNTLIYFRSKPQLKALQKLQYACKIGAILLLGKSESLTFGEYNFDVLNSRLKMFQCNQRNAASYINSEIGNRTIGRTKSDSALPEKQDKLASAIQLAEQTLYEQYLPAALLVNEKSEIIHVYTDVSPYIELRKGNLSYSLNQVLPDKLVPIASALMFRVKKQGTSVCSDHIQFDAKQSDEKMQLQIEGHPIIEGGYCSHVLLVIKQLTSTFCETGEDAAQLSVDSENAMRMEQMELELKATRESLQSTIEELETTNEELQATNEELMASNEELQSSNEELQSVNEELNTVNAEYHEKMNILNRINADLDTMSRAVGIATIFLDQEIRLTRFTPDALDIFKLRESDIGRPLNEIVHILEHPGFFEDIDRVLQTGRMLEKHVSAGPDKYYLLRIVNYNLPSSHKSGVVISFIDISAMKNSEQLQLVIDALPEHIAVLDHKGTIVRVNRAWNQFAQANGDAELQTTSIGINYLQVCGNIEHPDSDAKKANMGIKSVLEGSLPTFSMEYPCHSPTEERWFAMEVVPLSHELFGAVVSHFNISGWKRKLSV